MTADYMLAILLSVTTVASVVVIVLPRLQDWLYETSMRWPKSYRTTLTWPGILFMFQIYSWQLTKH